MTDAPASPPPASPEHEHISAIMRRLMATAEAGDTISIGQILHMFGVRGFAFLLLVLALLNIVIFMVPLISILFGLPMIILAAQMVLGLKAPIFPQVMLDRTIRRDALMKGLGHAIFWLEKIERYIKPRLPFLTVPNSTAYMACWP